VDRIRLVERISDRPFSFRRCVLSVLLIVILLPAGTAAQASIYTGMLTPHVGMAHGGDIDDRGLTLGVSLTAVETGGIGAELDLSHARQFDDSRFAESGITALMVNVIGMFPDETVRPFVVAGVGLLRVRASLADGEAIASRTDWGFDAGGGLLYMLNEAVGIRGDVRYFRYFQRHEDLPLLDNGFFDFWRTSVGVTFAWPIR
jgi:opacity protein-like surface antigen